MVTEDGHRPVGTVVGQNLSWDAVISWRPQYDSVNKKFKIIEIVFNLIEI